MIKQNLSQEDKNKAVEILKNLVAFLVLMEGNDGVLGKSPDYIMEKFQRYVGKSDDAYNGGLDSDNYKKLNDWINRWMK